MPSVESLLKTQGNTMQHGAEISELRDTQTYLNTHIAS